MIAHPLAHQICQSELYDLHTASSCLALWAFYLALHVQLKVLCSESFLRKLQPLHSSQLKSPQSNQSFHKAPGDSPSQLSPAKNLSVVIIHVE